MNAVLPHKKTALISQNGFINQGNERVFSPLCSSREYSETPHSRLSIVSVGKILPKVKRFFSKIFNARRGDNGVVYSWHEITKSNYARKLALWQKSRKGNLK